MAPPTRVVSAIARAIEDLRGQMLEARWVPPGNVHATLAFLGATTLIEQVSAAVAEVAADHDPFALALEGFGSFPRRGRARVLWAGLTGETTALAALANDVRAALAPLGFEPDARPFAAHLTLARFATPVSLDGMRWPGLSTEPFTVGHATVFESRLGGHAPAYSAVAECPLRGARGPLLDLPGRDSDGPST